MSDDTLRDTWLSLRQRLLARGLMPGDSDSLSLRDPASGQMAWGTATDASMRSLPLAPAEGCGTGAVALHRTVYSARIDVCAVLVGGGPFCRQMAAFGGWMPAVFDEQIRQLGHMAHPTNDLARLPDALADGGNVALHAGQLLVLGMTPSRLALNAELFEKCAKAWVPATAGGAKLRTLPWIVRHVANGRLMKEEARAQEQVRQGLRPEETRGY
ncbi:hypothetical protein [Mitsuaria sp. 7]|uniref:hypothetical protein n=1 Tax=Mitsuaria sp. 7 TaxID=1658665 RepID=UPI0007DE2319|nr:hypothetical protein [Mitsuaria sp. 7]ANH67016.1 hypothetical protein ABE85_04515 [Mitsuaria sp. 7]